MDLCQDYRVLDLDDLLEAIRLRKEFAVRSFILGVFRVICSKKFMSLQQAIPIRSGTLTLHNPGNPNENILVQ